MGSSKKKSSKAKRRATSKKPVIVRKARKGVEKRKRLVDLIAKM